MAIGYRLDAERGLTVVVWDGDVSSEEATRHLLRVAADASWPPGPLHLTDLTTAGRIEAHDPELLGELVAGEAPFRGVVVAPESSVAAQRFERAAASVGTVIAVFEQLSEACAWLGIDDATARGMLDAIRADLR